MFFRIVRPVLRHYPFEMHKSACNIFYASCLFISNAMIVYYVGNSQINTEDEYIKLFLKYGMI